MTTYGEVFSDWERLWSIAPANDMTGAYVDQDDLDKLLRSPNKRTAKDCLNRQIYHWFEAGVESGGETGIPASEVILRHPEIEDIAGKYGYGHLLSEPEQGMVYE